MDITQLKTLIHVAELGSLSKAADRLNIAQPALSRQMRLLEEELGAPLFERHGRGMVITDIGKEVLEHAVRVMAELESVRNTVAKGRTSYRGTVLVGMTPTVGAIVTLPLVKRIREEHPELGVRFTTAFSGFLLDWLQRGDLEVVVSYDPQPLRSLRIIPVMTEDLLFVGPASAGLKISSRLQFSKIAQHELILPGPRHGLRTLIDECARQAGIKLETRVEIESFGTMIDLVRAGLGCTVLPLAPIHKLIAEKKLSAAKLVNPTPTRKLVLAYSAERPVNPSARFVGEAFSEIARGLIKRGEWMGRLLDTEAKHTRGSPS